MPTNQRARGSRVPSTPIRIGNCVVGHVVGDTFYKRVRGSKHFLRNPRGIAFDQSTLREAEAAGATQVHITDTETGKEYQLPMGTIWQRGFALNRGHGAQWVVAMDEWNRDQRPQYTQMALWSAGSTSADA